MKTYLNESKHYVCKLIYVKMSTFDDVLENIQNLKTLFDNIENPDKKLVLNRMFMKHIENFVNKMEELYYKKIIMDKSITRLKNNQEVDIYKTYNTMNAFLPFIIAYNINNHV